MTPRLLLPTLLLPLALAIGCAKHSGSGGSMANDIELTGVASLDDVFRQARDIEVRLDGARSKLTAGRTSLNSALGLPNGTPFADALADLSQKANGQLQVVMQGTKPTLQASDAVPANVQAAVDSANAALASYQDALSEVTAVAGETQELTSAVQGLVNKITTEPGSLGLSLSQIPSVARTSKNNLELVGNFPSRVTKLTDELQANLSAVTTAFKGGGGATASGSATSDNNGAAMGSSSSGSSSSGSSSSGSSSSGSSSSGGTAGTGEKRKSSPMPH